MLHVIYAAKSSQYSSISNYIAQFRPPKSKLRFFHSSIIFSPEVYYLCEIGLEKMPYGSSWLYKSYTEESLTHITITAYYNVDEAFLQTPTAAWGNLWDCRAALRKLVSSVYLESDLNLPFGKNGKFLFQLGYTPVVSDMKKIVQKTVALSFPQWALAVWEWILQHYIWSNTTEVIDFLCLSVIPFVTRPTALLSSLMVETPALKETFRKTQRGDHF